MKGQTTSVVPMIICNPNTQNLIANCELIGTSVYQTCGIVLNNCNAIIKESSISGFNKGGLISV